jgi:hypothetical protein
MNVHKFTLIKDYLIILKTLTYQKYNSVFIKSSVSDGIPSTATNTQYYVNIEAITTHL